MASDLIERLRLHANSYGISVPEDTRELIRLAATALAIERERAEKAEKDRDRWEKGFITLETSSNFWLKSYEEARNDGQSLRASLAEAKRLMKPFGLAAPYWQGFHDYQQITHRPNSLEVGGLRAAARFLAQEEGR